MIAWCLHMYRFLQRHPLTASTPGQGLRRALVWQIASRLCPFDMLMPWVGGTRFIVRRGMTGATGNWYAGLHEFEDMGFVLHFLRPDDLFFDVGANVGAYTVLAAGGTGAGVLALEPGDDARAILAANVRVNDLGKRVKVSDEGVAAADGLAYFTTGRDTLNRLTDSPDPGTVQINVRSLDSLAAAQAPIAIKLDVEGGEFDALSGAAELLKDPHLRVMILELNDNTAAAGHSTREIRELLEKHGFEPCSYNPRTREILSANQARTENVIFVREREFVETRLREAKPFEILGQKI